MKLKAIKYYDIFRKSLAMALKNKLMWFFGLIIFLSSIFSNIMNIFSITVNKEQMQPLVIMAKENPLFFLKAVIVFVLLWLVFFLLRFIAIAGIIKSANNINVYKQSKIRTIFYEGIKYLWPMFLIEIIISFGLTVIFLALYFPVLYLLVLGEKFFAASLFLTASFIVTIIVVVAYYLKKYAYLYAVLGNMKIKMAIEEAYRLLVKNIWESLIMGCFVGILQALFSAVLLSLLFFDLAIYSQIVEMKNIFIGLIMVIEILIFMALFSIYASFYQIVWVLFFQEISLEKKENKFVKELETETKEATPETI